MSDPSPFVANPYLLPVSLAACLTGIAVLAFISMRSAREARSTIFPVVREEETIKARRARYGVAFMSFMVGGIIAIWIITGGPAASRPEDQLASAPTRAAKITPTATLQAEPQGEALPADTSPPAAEPTEKPAPATEEAPTAPPATPPPPPPSPPPSPTPVPPSPTPPDDTPTPAPTAMPTLDFSNALPASGDASLGPITLARGVENKKPVEPTKSFLLDGNAIYAIFPYEGMRNGVRWAVGWYRDDKEIVRDEELWRYGNQDVIYRYFIPGAAGNYKVVVFLEDRVAASETFEVQKMGIGGPKETPNP
jgi:hypothetical protein